MTVILLFVLILREDVHCDLVFEAPILQLDNTQPNKMTRDSKTTHGLKFVLFQKSKRTANL